LVGSYNQSLRDTTIDLQDYAFASVVTGRPIFFSAMNTLVAKTLDQGGLQKIAMLMRDELMQRAQHPYLKPLGLDHPDKALEESLRQIENVFHQSMVRWFSLGLMRNQA
jgi:hypothetical protein